MVVVVVWVLCVVVGCWLSCLCLFVFVCVRLCLFVVVSGCLCSIVCVWLGVCSCVFHVPFDSLVFVFLSLYLPHVVFFFLFFPLLLQNSTLPNTALQAKNTSHCRSVHTITQRFQAPHHMSPTVRQLSKIPPDADIASLVYTLWGSGRPEPPLNALQLRCFLSGHASQPARWTTHTIRGRQGLFSFFDLIARFLSIVPLSSSFATRWRSRGGWICPLAPRHFQVPPHTELTCG